jgi:hypothetical protein
VQSELAVAGNATAAKNQAIPEIVRQGSADADGVVQRGAAIGERATQAKKGALENEQQSDVQTDEAAGQKHRQTRQRGAAIEGNATQAVTKEGGAGGNGGQAGGKAGFETKEAGQGDANLAGNFTQAVANQEGAAENGGGAHLQRSPKFLRNVILAVVKKDAGSAKPGQAVAKPSIGRNGPKTPTPTGQRAVFVAPSPREAPGGKTATVENARTAVRKPTGLNASVPPRSVARRIQMAGNGTMGKE